MEARVNRLWAAQAKPTCAELSVQFLWCKSCESWAGTNCTTCGAPTCTSQAPVAGREVSVTLCTLIILYWVTGCEVQNYLANRSVGQLSAQGLDDPGWMESVSFVALSCLEPKRAWTWTKVASARSVVGMDKGIEGIKIISLRHWLQNMGLWHHSCFSLCAQSKAFLILCWLSIVPHKRGNLKLNVLFWGCRARSAGQGAVLGLLSSAHSLPCSLFCTGCHREEFRKYICMMQLCL